MNTAVLGAQRTVHSTTQQTGSPSGRWASSIGKNGTPRAATTENPLVGLSLASTARWEGKVPSEQEQEQERQQARSVLKVSPMDGTIVRVMKGNSNDERARAWGASSGMEKYSPSVPQARDALRAASRTSGT